MDSSSDSRQKSKDRKIIEWWCLVEDSKVLKQSKRFLVGVQRDNGKYCRLNQERLSRALKWQTRLKVIWGSQIYQEILIGHYEYEKWRKTIVSLLYDCLIYLFEH